MDVAISKAARRGGCNTVAEPDHHRPMESIMATHESTRTAPEIQHHRQVLAAADFLLGRLSAAPDGDLKSAISTAAARSAAALAA